MVANKYIMQTRSCSRAKYSGKIRKWEYTEQFAQAYCMPLKPLLWLKIGEISGDNRNET